MAIKMQRKANITAVEVISKNDDALDLANSNWEEYAKTGELKHLKFVEGKQPTIFLCNFALKGKESAAIKDTMLGGTDEEGRPKIAMGSWSFRVAKYTLKDIQNPADLPEAERIVFKKDERGYAHDDLIALLDEFGIVSEIFSMYANLVLGSAQANAKN